MRSSTGSVRCPTRMMCLLQEIEQRRRRNSSGRVYESEEFQSAPPRIAAESSPVAGVELAGRSRRTSSLSFSAMMSA